MEIKLLAMDLDGTALQSDRKTFSPRLNAALEAAYRAGVTIVPVTGRQYGLLPPAVQNHPVWESLVVCINGGQIRDLADGTLHSSLDIAPKALKDLLALARRYDLPMEFSVDSRLHLTRHDYQLQLDDPGLVFHRDTILANHGVFVDALEPLCREKVEKVNLLCVPDHLRDAVVADLRQIEVSAVWSSHNCMEITHPDATKGNALEELSRMLDIPMASVMALGDSGNDETMLRRAGLGVAMGNAPDEVKAFADVVTETNRNDGAALAIERYILGR